MKYKIMAIIICMATTTVTAQWKIEPRQGKTSKNIILPINEDTLEIPELSFIKFIKFGNRLYEVIPTTLKESIISNGWKITAFSLPNAMDKVSYWVGEDTCKYIINPIRSN